MLDGPGGIGKTALALATPRSGRALSLFITASQPQPDGVMICINVADYYASPKSVWRWAIIRRIGTGAPRAGDLPGLAGVDNLAKVSRANQRRHDLLEVLPSSCRAIITSRRTKSAYVGGWTNLISKRPVVGHIGRKPAGAKLTLMLYAERAILLT